MQQTLKSFFLKIKEKLIYQTEFETMQKKITSYRICKISSSYCR